MMVLVFRPLFTVRRSLLVLGIVVVGLAFPAVAAAGVNPCGQSSQGTCELKTKPIHVGSKGFELKLFISQSIVDTYGGPVKGTSFAAVLFRHKGHATENDYYSFVGGGGHPLKFGWGKRLQFAKVKGTFGGGRGSINLTFRATGPARHVILCRGHGGRRRQGTLSGSFTLHADKLGTITRKSFKATISTPAYTCSRPTHEYGVQTNASHGLPLLIVHKPSPTGPVTETIEAFRGSRFGDFFHTYTVSGLPSSDFAFNPATLSAGHVKGAGGISGTATYESKHSSTKLTIGRMSGSLAVTFASIGRMTPFPNSRAAEEWAPKANR